MHMNSDSSKESSRDKDEYSENVWMLSLWQLLKVGRGKRRMKQIPIKKRRSARRAAHAHCADELHVSPEVRQLPAAAASVGCSLKTLRSLQDSLTHTHTHPSRGLHRTSILVLSYTNTGTSARKFCQPWPSSIRLTFKVCVVSAQNFANYRKIQSYSCSCCSCDGQSQLLASQPFAEKRSWLSEREKRGRQADNWLWAMSYMYI